MSSTHTVPDRIGIIAARLGATPLARWTDDDVWAFFDAARYEASAGGLSDAEQAKLFDYKRGLGTMLSRPAYYRQAYCRPFHGAVRAIGRRVPTPRVLDVCCGSGGQSIALALAGADVIGIDLDTEQVDLARRRAQVWQQAARRALKLEFRNGDVLDIDVATWGTYDAVYSHSGIGTFLPAAELFRRFAPCVSPGGLLILKNGNPQCWWLRVAGRTPGDSSRREYLEQAAAFGFRPLVAGGTTAIPRPLWLLGDVLRGPDALLRPITPLQVTLQYIFEKR